ncbi:MAG: hypothetical protein PVJ57_01840 [Phycisphaerae bacterium]|jgi:ssDNA-binding Zn-finger/Zn-ribbon topoisomerase 1
MKPAEQCPSCGGALRRRRRRSQCTACGWVQQSRRRIAWPLRLIATLPVFAVALVAYWLVIRQTRLPYYLMGALGRIELALIVMTIPPFLVTLLVYHWLTLTDGVYGSGRLRCPRCRHTLARLTEPRCPQCGWEI